MKPVTANLIQALTFDTWPSPSVMIDFGIDSPEHLGALQWAFRNDKTTSEELDEALGDGPALTEIAGRTPYKHVKFSTVWDSMGEWPDEA